MSQDLSQSGQNAQQTTRLSELAEHAAQTEAQISMLEQQLATASGEQRMDAENQLRALIAEYSSTVKEANALRTQLGLPVVVPVVPLPAIMTDQPAGDRNDEWATTEEHP